jgi:hypothetical protein
MPAPPEVPVKARAAYVARHDPRARPNYRWLSQLTGETERELRTTIGEVGAFTEWEEQIHMTQVAGGRAFYADIRAPFELFALTRRLKPKHIVETGVSSGVSSAHFLMGVRRNRSGRLHSIDFPSVQKTAELGANEASTKIPPGRSSGWAIPRPLRANWDLRLGMSQDLLPPLVKELPEIGLFLHDSLHTPAHLTFELSTIEPKLAPGAVVLADNTKWTGQAFPQFAKKLGAKVCRRGSSDLVALRVPDR